MLDRGSGTLFRLNPRTDTVGSPIRVGESPSDLVAPFSHIWVVNEGSGTISRVDPLTGAVMEIEVGGSPTHIAADGDTGAIWVAGPEMSEMD